MARPAVCAGILRGSEGLGRVVRHLVDPALMKRVLMRE